MRTTFCPHLVSAETHVVTYTFFLLHALAMNNLQMEIWNLLNFIKEGGKGDRKERKGGREGQKERKKEDISTARLWLDLMVKELTQNTT